MIAIFAFLLCVIPKISTSASRAVRLIDPYVRHSGGGRNPPGILNLTQKNLDAGLRRHDKL